MSELDEKIDKLAETLQLEYKIYSANFFKDDLRKAIFELVNEARADELQNTVVKPIKGKSWVYVRPDIELARVMKRIAQLRKGEE